MLRQAVRAGLRGCLRRLGLFVSKHPVFFLATPVLLSALLGSSLSRYELEDAPESLFAPEHSLARLERGFARSIFPDNRSATPAALLFDGPHVPGRYGRLVATAVSGRGRAQGPPSRSDRGVLGTAVARAVLRVHSAVVDMRVPVHGFNYTYRRVCAQNGANGRCAQDPAIDMLKQEVAADDSAPPKVVGDRRSTLSTSPSSHALFLGARLGGLSLDSQGRVRSARAVRITYPLRSGETAEDLAADAWEEAFCRTVEGLREPGLRLYPLTSSSLRQDLELSGSLSVPYLAACAAVLTIALVLCCSMRDPVRTKPWLGLLGLLTFVLSSLTTAGILNLSAGRFNSTLVGLPFIVIGHGIHGMFEMLWAWRKTKEEEPVRERLSTVYADALVTYTLTTLTYLVTFGLAASPFSNLGVIKVFSRAVCLAVVFNYLYLLCFFGSCLVFSGYLERKAYHGLYCVKVVPSIHEGEDTEAPPSGWCYPTLRFYHHHDSNRHTPGASASDVHNFHVLVWFLREFVAKWVTNTYVRPFMVLLYLIYVSFAMMGCLQTELPCDLSVLLPVKSQTLRYRAVHQTFFGSLTPIIGLYVYEPLAYWNASVRAEIGDITGGFVRLSWLEEFTLFLDHHNDSVNVSKEHFLRSLLGPFLHAPDYARFADDLVLNHSARPSPEIKASRIFLAARTTNRSNASSLQALLETLRLLSVSTDLHFIAYSPSFIFVDRCAASLSGALAIPCVSFVFLLVLSALVVVEPLGNAWVIVCVASVEFGTIGYLTLWGVDLDYVSVLCLNFALSYAAGHCSTIAFAFVSGRELTRTRWTQLALELQGAPVVQSLLCFTIAVLPLALVPSNLTYTMFRCYLAAGLSTILHVLVILPVMLTFFPPSKKARQQKKRCEQHEEIECVELHCENRVMADQVTAL